MLRTRFLDSGMWVVGGLLLFAVVGAVLALGPTAVERWF